MSRLIKNTTILAKIETTYGTDSIPTGAANAILVSECSINHVYNNVARNLIRSFLGASEELVGTKYIEISFKVELQNGGTAGTAPAWGPLLRACAFAEATLATPSRVEYTPVSTSFESLSMYYYMDGVLHKALGCLGTVDFGLGIGERAEMTFKFVGIDAGATAAAPSGVSYTGFKTPMVVTKNNVSQFLIGCTYAAGALSAGTAYVSRGLTFSANNAVQFTPLIGAETVDLTDRQATGALSLDLTAAQEVTLRADIAANTLTSVGMKLGATAGYAVMVYLPTCQRINPKYEDVNGKLMVAMDLRLVPSAGNDEMRIVLL